ncbi:MAG: hypothetical protein JXQ66_00140 [Campylobacterales bacterium]|nr:hypothetical protein [Campylobacterales bacterium]
MKYLPLLIIFFLNGCSIKNYEQTQPKLITIKSPKIKFSDIGYLRNSGDAIELELFSAGVAVEKITINHLICVSSGCMGKAGFNDEYLNHSYPSDTLQNILLAKPIYSAMGIVKKDDGYEQHVKDEAVDIVYKVKNGETSFKDKKNHIIFKIKDTK